MGLNGLRRLFGGARKAPARTPLVLPRAARVGELPADSGAIVAGVSLPDGRRVVADASHGGDVTSPVLWCSLAPVKGKDELAAALRRGFESTGLWPLVLDTLDRGPERPWLDGEFAPRSSAIAAAGEHRAFDVLAKVWSDDFSDFAAEDDGQATSASFPGLIELPGGPLDCIDEGFAAAPGRYLGLVAVERPADVPARIGWMGAVNVSTLHADRITAVLRSWEERFGAVLVGLGFDTLTLAIGRPPRTAEEAQGVASELAAFCPDLVHQGVGSLQALAEEILGADTWQFWWD